jgi:hypothetical protein
VGGGHVYVADRNNSRIQVFDMDLNFQKYITRIGQPWTVQYTPKYLYRRSPVTARSIAWIMTASCWAGRRPVLVRARPDA